MRYATAALLAVLCLAETGLAADDKGDAELVALEQKKWDPSLLSSPQDMAALFADDFISVEYGADVSGGVQRKTRTEVFSGPPLPPAVFELSDFKVIHPSADAAIVSYRVTGKSFAWKAYATSVWGRRHGKWTTVFYQASTAR